MFAFKGFCQIMQKKQEKKRVQPQKQGKQQVIKAQKY